MDENPPQTARFYIFRVWFSLKFSMPAPPLQYIDLFAGCGGSITGLHLAAWQGLFASEWSKAAFSTVEAGVIENRAHFAWPGWLTARLWDIQVLLKDHAISSEVLAKHMKNKKRFKT
jgi:site-specific DNA-cytosine methylase